MTHVWLCQCLWPGKEAFLSLPASSWDTLGTQWFSRAFTTHAVSKTQLFTKYIKKIKIADYYKNIYKMHLGDVSTSPYALLYSIVPQCSNMKLLCILAYENSTLCCSIPMTRLLVWKQHFVFRFLFFFCFAIMLHLMHLL